MDRSRLPFIAGVAVLVTAAPGRADLHPIAVPRGDGHVLTIEVGSLRSVEWDGLRFAREGPARAPTEDAWARSCLDGPLGFVLGTNFAGVASCSRSEVHELPPDPGSASLFLSAVLSIGGWHLVRSARHLHFGALPEWYHAGGPDQIGHAAPFDLGLSALPLCHIEPADGGVDERPFLHRLRCGLRPRCEARLCLTITAPRGPPMFSS